MNAKGILQLEAMFCFAAFVAITALFIASINEGWAGAGQALDAVKAKANAESCCIIADAIFAGSAFGISNVEMPCSASGGTMESTANAQTKKCGCLSTEVRLSQAGANSILEVKTDGHYIQ